MSNDVFKIKNIDDNNDLNERHLLNALVLKYLNPIVSIPFVCKNENQKKIENLCKRANIIYKDNAFYDEHNNLINRDVIIDIISDDLCTSAKLFLESDDDKLYHANMIKYILRNNVLSKKEECENDKILTVEDLMSKLYEKKESKIK